MTSLILMYHDLQPGGGGAVPPDHRPYVLDVASFRRHLEAVHAASVPTRRVVDWASGTAPGGRITSPRPKGREVIFTFDDGDLSNHDHALPLLQEFGMVATFFVTAGRIGEPGALDGPRLAALHRGGMEVGSHTLTHRPPRDLSDHELRYELVESKKRIEDHLGAEVRSLSSPTGFFNPRMRDLAREAGYTALCYSRIGLVREGADPYLLPRVAVKYGLSDARFDRLIRQDRALLLRLRAGQAIRDGLKRALGTRGYLRWRRRILGLGRGR